jgi:hypothetical protein
LRAGYLNGFGHLGAIKRDFDSIIPRPDIVLGCLILAAFNSRNLSGDEPLEREYNEVETYDLLQWESLEFRDITNSHIFKKWARRENVSVEHYKHI